MAPGVPAPQEAVHVPVEEPVARHGVRETAPVMAQQPAHDGEGGASVEDPSMVEPQTPAECVEQVGDGLDCAAQPGLEVRNGDVRELGELRLAREDGVDVAQQPVELEVEARLRPTAKGLIHGGTCGRPCGADGGQCQVARQGAVSGALVQRAIQQSTSRARVSGAVTTAAEVVRAVASSPGPRQGRLGSGSSVDRASP